MTDLPPQARALAGDAMAARQRGDAAAERRRAAVLAAERVGPHESLRGHDPIRVRTQATVNLMKRSKLAAEMVACLVLEILGGEPQDGRG